MGMPMTETSGIHGSERRRTAPTLRRNEAFARAFDLAQAMVRDLDGRIRVWSSGMERLYGWTRDAAIGRISHELLRTEFPKPLHEIEAELLQSGHWQGELTHRGRDGQQVTVASHWALDRDESGNPLAVIEVNNDITPLKALEEERGRMNASRRRRDAWLSMQRDAFRSAVNGAPLAETLQILIRTAIQHIAGNGRCAFYVANAEGTELRHVVGMPEDYARHVDGFKVGADSLACGLAVATGKAVITPDVLLEPRWTPWLWLAREFDYRGSWSFPIETSAGKLVGTFAMYFREPRNPTARDRQLAAILTDIASIIISRNQEAEERAIATQALLESEARLRASEARLQIAVDLVKLGRSAWNLETNEIEWDDTLRAMWGLPAGAPVDYRTWRAGVHPDDRERALAAVRRRSDPRDDGLYAIEYRVIGQDGVERWIASRGRTTFENGRAISYLGVALDITERKRAERANLLLIAELQHRTRNLLAVVSGIATDTLAASSSLADFSATFGDRLAALSRVQSLVSRGDVTSVTIGELVSMELKAHGAEPDGRRITVEGPEVTLPSNSAQVLALALHELATNARKHGALAAPEGRLAVTWRRTYEDAESRLVIEWREHSTAAGREKSPPARKGFGRTLIEEALPYELDAQSRLEFGPSGVFCSVTIGLGSQQIGAA
jgi:PAS domain S-box-containing protein